MAFRSTKLNSKRKRSTYVSSDESTNSCTWDASSDEDGPYITVSKKKVRDSKSIKMLLKKSNSYEKSDEHGYTQPSYCRPTRTKRPSNEETDEDFTNSRRVSKKPRCESRNAINARINRERKKAYVADLEDKVEALKRENKEFTFQLDDQKKVITKLSADVSRLRSLLANSKYLSALVGKLSNLTGLPVTSSLLPVENTNDVSSPVTNKYEESRPLTKTVSEGNNHPIARHDVNLGYIDNDTPFFDNIDSLFPIMENEPFSELDCELYDEGLISDLDNNFGICVHINQNRLSVEFCSVCNSSASAV